ncbi:fibulin-2-like [Ambystoma mexicanum]|uniref:fibulin-2-like n=1 Tax=Ambystoma mexicanum TaxID=8296 RepID=UPI0037E75D70
MPSPSLSLWLCLWMACLSPGTDSKPDPCAGVPCDPLPIDCYVSIRDSDCCSNCTQLGCACPEYYTEECFYSTGPLGVLPIGGSFLSDFGYKLCTCVSEGNVTCAPIPCPALPPNCLRTRTPMDSPCPHCVCSGFGYAAVEAGTVFTNAFGTCVCPVNGGDLNCTAHPTPS